MVNPYNENELFPIKPKHPSGFKTSRLNVKNTMTPSSSAMFKDTTTTSSRIDFNPNQNIVPLDFKGSNHFNVVA